MIIITGGAGFIGSNLVKSLNDAGQQDILIVDHLKNSAKMENLRGLQFLDYQDKTRFLSRVEQGGKGLTFGDLAVPEKVEMLEKPETVCVAVF